MAVAGRLVEVAVRDGTAVLVGGIGVEDGVMIRVGTRVATTTELVAVAVAGCTVRVGVLDESAVFVAVLVAVLLGGCVGVNVLVLEGVIVPVEVDAAVTVEVAVGMAVFVLVEVAVGVFVASGVFVAVGVIVGVCVATAVLVAVLVATAVLVGMPVAVPVAVKIGVGVVEDVGTLVLVAV